MKTITIKIVGRVSDVDATGIAYSLTHCGGDRVRWPDERIECTRRGDTFTVKPYKPAKKPLAPKP